MLSNPVELFDRIGRDPCYWAGLSEWLDALALSTDVRILEMGCGPGAIALELARRQHAVAAMDCSERMIARLEKAAAKAELRVTSHVADACETGLSSCAFDAVIGASLLNIVGNPGALVTEALRLVQPGGKVSFYFPNSTLNRTNSLRFIRDKRLPPSSAAMLLTWSGGARKLDEPVAEALLRTAGAKEIQLRKHLEGMVSSVTGLRAA